jgi:hypothetical protein
MGASNQKYIKRCSRLLIIFVSVQFIDASPQVSSSHTQRERLACKVVCVLYNPHNIFSNYYLWEYTEHSLGVPWGYCHSIQRPIGPNTGFWCQTSNVRVHSKRIQQI